MPVSAAFLASAIPPPTCPPFSDVARCLGLQVFDLGASGVSPAQKVAEVPDFHAAACQALGNVSGQVFHSGDHKGSGIKYLTPIGKPVVWLLTS